jgi:hypothetical protein
MDRSTQTGREGSCGDHIVGQSMLSFCEIRGHAVGVVVEKEEG